MNFHIFKPQMPLFEKIEQAFAKGNDMTVFETAADLKASTAPVGPLLVFAGTSDAYPPEAYDVARERGMPVWHISDSYAKAKAERETREATTSAPAGGTTAENGTTGKRPPGPDEEKGLAAAQGLVAGDPGEEKAAVPRAAEVGED